jgi:mono/diheme cytochrome c family protein/rhodanese-related sulfurtransferase
MNVRLRRVRPWAVTALLSVPLSLLLAVACKPATTSATSGDASASRDAAGRDGLALYTSLCAVCHGADGTGYKADNAPSLVNATFLESATDEQLRRSIVDGRPGTSMAAYGKERGGPLRPDEIERLVAWIRSRGGASTKPIPPRQPGDPARGAPLYAAHCERCHGTATSRANAVHLANPRFLEVASDAFIGWAIRRGRPGTPMEAWEGKLSSAEIDDVVAHVRSFEKPARPSELPPPTGKEPIVIHPQGQHPTFTPRSSPCPPGPCTPDNRFVSVAQVKEALDAKRRIVIIDARPPSDWMRVHIPGAVSIPYHDLKRLDEVPNDGTWVVAYCACPHHLSGDVVDALRKRGVAHAVVLDEGILEWHRRGYPVVAAAGVEPPPPTTPPLTPPPQPRRGR